ncbi:MAG: leucine-rich repeat protein [Clostridiales bacterium]|nr:leucine-rich repeat protein [Clostridiales bacterium]
MKANKVLCALLVIMIAMVAIFAVACQKKEQTKEGPETGIYFCDAVGGEEYTLSLLGGDRFIFEIKGEQKTGKYELVDASLTLKTEESEINAKYENERITFTYDGINLEFRRKVTYTVTFDKGNGTETQSVLGGRTVIKPEDPTYEGRVFLGWYKDREYKTPYAFGIERVENNIILFAKWTETLPSEAEYRIEFNYGEGYTGTRLNAKETIGGKLYNVEEPKWEGHTFNGWWISSSRESGKLTCKYSESETVFAESTTLYANWADELDLEIKGNEISWTAGIGSTSTVKITAPDGSTETPNVTGGSLTYAFSDKAAGEYKVEVIVSAGASTSRATRYYNNKALDRVSLFSVVGTDLVFNKIANAERYVISVECGNERHNHSKVDNGLSTTYNFASCPQKEGGIIFTVEAEADGYISSTREYKLERALEQISEASIKFDEESGLVTWAEVPFASSYIVAISDGTTSKEEEIGNKTSYDFKEYSGEITFNVRAIASGYYAPDYTSISYTRTKPASPKEIKVLGKTISWEAVTGATNGYSVYIDGEKTDVAAGTTELDIADKAASWSDGSEHRVYVVAKGSSESLRSEEIRVFNNTMYGTLRYKGSVVSWQPVVGAAYYVVYVNGVTLEENETIVHITDSNSYEVELTQAGYNAITVRCYFEDGYYESASIEVEAKTLIFYDKEGGIIDVQYKVNGDKITLPSDSEKAGYDFAGWYNTPFGAKGNGAEFTDKVFRGKDDIALYADYLPKTFKVSLECAPYGDQAIKEAEVLYGEHFTLPIPQTKDVAMGFIGWYKENEEELLTDENGRSLKTWDIANDTTVYARWVRIFVFDKRTDENTYAVIAADGLDYFSEATVPAYYKGEEDDAALPVLQIDAYAFRNKANLLKVNIPENLTGIGIDAFAGCSSLEEINVYNVTGTTHPTYYSRDGILFSDIIEDDVNKKVLEVYPAGKKGSYTIPNDVDIIGINAFGNSLIREVVIPAKVCLIEGRAFSGCANLSNVTFVDSSVELTIGRLAFENCTSLETITLPSRLISIVWEVENTYDPNVTTFVGCTALKEINVAKGCVNYSSKNGLLLNGSSTTVYYAPYCMTGKVDIPSGVSTISQYTFYQMQGITEVVFPVSLTTIETYAFNRCLNLAKITFNSGAINVQIGISAFEFCAITELDIAGVVSIGERAFYYCDSLKELTLREGLESIDYEAFRDCAIEEINLPSSLTYISSNAFYRCFDLQRISVANGGAKYRAESNCLIDSQSNTVVFGCKTSIIPNGVTAIGNIAFLDIDIREIDLPDSVVKIGDSAFSGCSQLSNVTFGAGLKEIGPYAFFNCTALKSINFNKALTYIGNYAFRDCTQLENVTFDKDSELKTIGSHAFRECEKLTQIVLPNTLTNIESFAFSQSGLVSIVIPQSISVLSDWVFSNCRSLSEVILPEGLLEIKICAFSGCSALTKITLPQSLKSLGDSAFSMTGLVNIIIPKNVNSIADSIFYWCTDLTKVEIYANINSMGKNVFYSCEKLQSVIIYGSVTSIGKESFYYCPEMQSIDLSDAKSIAYDAFGNCYKLTTVTLGHDLKTIDDYAFYNCYSLNTINYDGTINEWNNIKKGYGWDYGVKNYNVYCKDGYVDKDGKAHRN